MTEIQGGNPGITWLLIVLDASGSMSGSTESAVKRGVNALLKEQRENGHDEVHVGFTIFDSSVKRYPPRPLEDLPVFGSSKLPYEAHGFTALWDGVGMTVDEARNLSLKLPPAKRPGRVIVFVQTDGGENESRHYGAARVRKAVLEAKQQGWEFVFVGVGQHNTAQGPAIGITRTMSYNENETEEMLAAVSALSVALRTGQQVPDSKLRLDYFKRQRQDADVL